MHVLISKHMTNVNFMLDHKDEINNLDYHLKSLNSNKYNYQASESEYDITAAFY